MRVPASALIHQVTQNGELDDTSRTNQLSKMIDRKIRAVRCLLDNQDSEEEE